MSSPRARPDRPWGVASLVLGMTATAAWYAIPVDAGRSLPESEPDSAFWLWVPPVLVMIVIAMPANRLGKAVAVTTAAVYFTFVWLTGFSIGLFYLPSAVLALVAALRIPSKRARTT